MRKSVVCTVALSVIAGFVLVDEKTAAGVAPKIWGFSSDDSRRANNSGRLAGNC